MTFVTKDWAYVTRHFALKLIAWHHKGDWLAEPLINLLIKLGLHTKISLNFISYPHLVYYFHFLLQQILTNVTL